MAPIPQQAKKSLGNVVVIGGCGFLGHHIVNQLCDSYSCKVSVIDLRTDRNRRPDSDGVQYFDGDITNLDSLLSIFDRVKPDVVIHTASPVAVGELPKLFLQKVNVGGTKCVIEACQKTNVKALVYTSSASVISDNTSDLINADERWPVLRGKAQPDYYSATKAEAEDLVLAANRSEAKPSLLTAAIRPAGIVGEGDVQQVPAMLELYFNGRTNFQVGANDNLFDFTYVGNIAHAHLLAASLLLSTSKLSTMPLDHEKVDGEAFIITNDTPVYFWDWPRMLWKAAGHTEGTEKVWVISKEVGMPLASITQLVATITRRPSKFTPRGVKFSCMTRYYNITKAKQRLGYKPLVSLREGAERSVKWALDERARGAEKKAQ